MSIKYDKNVAINKLKNYLLFNRGFGRLCLDFKLKRLPSN